MSIKLSRRTFLRNTGLGVAAGLGSCLLLDHVDPAAAAEKVSAESWGMLIDLTRCAGCNSCTLACKESNNLPEAHIIPEALDEQAYTFVEPVSVITADGGNETRYVKRQCMHCLNAACVSACPAAAMYSSGEGPIVYRADRCLGCRYCAAVCPFTVPRFNWDDPLTAKINKCWFCYDRLQEGQKPACVKACPSGALRFGARTDLLVHAHALIESQPDRYIRSVFGETKVGGTSMLYLSDIPFEKLGFPANLPETAPPEQTEKVMSVLPYVIVGMASLMTGTAVYTHRHPADKVEEEI